MPRISEEQYAAIPALLAADKTRQEIAALYGVTSKTLQVLGSRRGISLRKGGQLMMTLPLSDIALKSLDDAAEAMGRPTGRHLASDLLERIVCERSLQGSAG